MEKYMEIVKIIGVGLIALIIIIILKQYKPEFVIYVSLLAGAIILLLSLDKISGIISLLNNLSTKANVNKDVYKRQALMMGNSIIVKPSNYNPLTLIEYVKLMLEAGVPAGCIQVLTGDGPIVGQALARHPGVHLVSLTGSTAAGIQTMGTASQNLTHVMLELGGNDAFIFLEDGDMDLAVKEATWGLSLIHI